MTTDEPDDGDGERKLVPLGVLEVLRDQLGRDAWEHVEKLLLEGSDKDCGKLNPGKEVGLIAAGSRNCNRGLQVADTLQA